MFTTGRFFVYLVGRLHVPNDEVCKGGLYCGKKAGKGLLIDAVPGRAPLR